MAIDVIDAAGNRFKIAGRGAVGPRGKPGPPGPKGDTGDDGNPIGTIIQFLGLAAPEGYLVCDGSTHNIADYPALSAFIAAQFGSANHFGGDGETTFAVPDMRNLFLRGYHGDAEDKLSGDVGVRQAGTLIPFIGSYGDPSYLKGANITFPYDNQPLGIFPINYDKKTEARDKAFLMNGDVSVFTGEAGFFAWHYYARPVNMAVLYCIKAEKTVPSAPVIQVVGSNINLLHNWYFPRPVNQRGQTSLALDASVEAWTRFFDRFECAMLGGAATFSIDSTGLFIPQNGGIMQRFETDLRNKRATASILTTDGQLYSRTFSASTVNQEFVDGPIIFKGLRDPNLSGDSANYIQFICNEAITAVAVKLELGDIQTLAHQDEYGTWVLNDPPPDYGAELARCQRYFCNTGATLKIRIAQKDGPNHRAWVTVPLPVTMRTAPTIASIGSGSLMYSIDGGSSAGIKSYGVEALCASGVTIWIESDIITSSFDGFVLLMDVCFDANL